jgi:Tfp pilus assembly protein PilN
MQVTVQVPDIPVPPTPPDPFFVPPPWVTLPPQVVLLITVAFIAGCTIVLWPLMRALARRIEGRQVANPALQGEIEQLRARVADVEVLQHRVAELEERVDFAERLLAQKREPERLGRGGV